LKNSKRIEPCPAFVPSLPHERTLTNVISSAGGGLWQTASINVWGRTLFVVLKLDYLSCVLTVISTILVGKRWWGGWVLAGINSMVLCVIGYRTSQLGFIPANIFCMVLYGLNVRSWRRAGEPLDAQPQAGSLPEHIPDSLLPRTNQSSQLFDPSGLSFVEVEGGKETVDVLLR